VRTYKHACYLGNPLFLNDIFFFKAVVLHYNGNKVLLFDSIKMHFVIYYN